MVTSGAAGFWVTTGTGRVVTPAKSVDLSARRR
jgi:hypothetical protein